MVLCGLLAAASGCSRAEPQFALRPETEELFPPAELYVQEVLEQNFGTPTEPIAWERLPLHFHAAEGTVAAVEDGIELTVALEEQTLPVAPGMEVTFLSGPALDANEAAAGAQQPVTRYAIADFDEQSGKARLATRLATEPQAGDRVAIGPGEVLRRGRLLYAEHCLHCHGVSGDGNGPTAKYLNPRPRDYRQGEFKFTSTLSGRRAQRDDLARIIENGIPGTYMPSFKLLTPDESKALVEYVLWLAMRGETELPLAKSTLADFTIDARNDALAAGTSADEFQLRFAAAFKEQFAPDFEANTSDLVDRWVQAQQPDSMVVPQAHRKPSTPESIANGRTLFLGDRAKCATCHGSAGQGNGPQTVAIQKDKEGNDRPEPGLYDDWGNEIQPRDLTSGIYRGGRRPVDLYRRVHAGIKGTPMTAFGTTLNDDEIWDLVNYVMSIPFEDRQPGEGPYVPAAPVEGVAAAQVQ
jgi:mono/diheme cytochrome c family protein